MKKMKKGIEAVWLPLYLALCTAMMFGSQIANQNSGIFKEAKALTGTGMNNFKTMLNTLVGAALGFVDQIKIVLIALVVGGFIWSISGQIRGQQIDLTEIFKNLVIFGILGAIIWFGPSWLIGMFDTMGGNNAQGANISNEFVIEETAEANIQSNLILEPSGNYAYFKQ